MSGLSPKKYPEQYILLMLSIALLPLLGWSAPFFWVIGYLVIGGLFSLKK
jgi:hypothetical protein